MPLFYVHECSKCKKRDESTTNVVPSGWAEAKIDVNAVVYGKDLGSEQDFLWCINCWTEIKRVSQFSVRS